MGMRFIISIILIGGFTSTIFAQKSKQVTVTGTVVDSRGEPIKKVQIYADSVWTKEKTNRKGRYKVKIGSDSKTISFYSEDHGIYDVAYSGQEEIDYSFPKKANKLNEEQLLALGYRTPPKTIAGSGEINFENDPTVAGYSDIFQLISVRFAGVNVVGESISIRGSANSSISDKVSTQPLFLVNGATVSSIASIPPDQVKSIKILKSTESTRYGMRGANGVVLITLK